MLVPVPHFMAAPTSIASPEKEARFTRAAQGRMWLVLAALHGAIALGLIVLATQGTELEAPRLQGCGWTAAFPLLASWAMFRLGVRCVRHAYLIFTPLGVEIFPLLRPEKSMQLLLWSEVHSLECSLPLQRLTIHFTAEKSSGVMVSLAPILPAQRELLRILVESINQRRISADTTTH
jgi:hypothetical protein